PLMAAIEKLINKKVEQRVIAGFEAGPSPSPDSAGPSARPRGRPESRGSESRRGQPRRGESRRGEPHRAEQHAYARAPQKPQRSDLPRFQQRPESRAYGADERAAQLLEHRRRLAEETAEVGQARETSAPLVR